MDPAQIAAIGSVSSEITLFVEEASKTIHQTVFGAIDALSMLSIHSAVVQW